MKPKYLTKNSSLYLIAPSFGCTTSPYQERLEKALKNFELLGFSYTLGKNVYKAEGICSSNTPQARALEFMNAYSSSADAIMSVGGGEVMCEMLEYVDFEKIKQLPPKWFVGFSDNTNLTYTLTTICDIETIYGNNAPNFYNYPLKYDSLQTYKMLLGSKTFSGFKKFQLNGKSDTFPKYNFDTEKVIKPVNYSKPFKGRLLGGCLDCLITLCGTKFDNTKNYIEKYKDDGIIFYLEACDLNSISIRRALFQLKNAGWFKYVKGFLIGRTNYYYDETFGQKPIDSYISLLSEYNVPILLDIDLGHISPSMPMRNGAKVKVEYKNNNITFNYYD